MSSARVASVSPTISPLSVVVDEHRAVAAVPVERDEAVRADRLLAGQLGQVLVDVDARARRRLVVARRDGVVDEPGEDVADAALARLVAPQPGRRSRRRTTPHMPGTSASASRVHDVARRGAHDHEHLARLDRLRGGRGDVGVDVADRDRDPLGQPGPRGGLRGQGARRARRAARAGPLELVGDEAGEALVERGAGSRPTGSPSWKMPL